MTYFCPVPLLLSPLLLSPSLPSAVPPTGDTQSSPGALLQIFEEAGKLVSLAITFLYENFPKQIDSSCTDHYVKIAFAESQSTGITSLVLITRVTHGGPSCLKLHLCRKPK